MYLQALCILYTVIPVNPLPVGLEGAAKKMPPFLKCLIELVLCISSAIPAHATATMRLDLFHTGGMGQEIFSVDRVVIEPLPWPGNPNQKADSTNRGTYFFEVRNASKRVLYSRGFSSIYGEWITTDEAKTINRTFHESLRFPAPKSPVEIVVKKRDPQNRFQDIWKTTVDPKRQEY